MVGTVARAITAGTVTSQSAASALRPSEDSASNGGGVSRYGTRKTIMVRLELLVLVSCVVACALQAHTCMAIAKNVPEAMQIKELVQKMEILQPETREQVYVTYERSVCTISLFRHPNGTRQDCKIDAVLLCKGLLELDPHIALVRCIFYDYDRQNEFWDVSVRTSLVTAFGSGKIDKDKLLNSITLKEDSQADPLSEKYKQTSYAGILNEDTVVPGSFEESRLALALRLRDLRSRKFDTSAFQQDFLRIEDLARRRQDDILQERIKSLEGSLNKYVQSLITSGQMSVPVTRLSRSLDLLSTGHSGLRKK